MTLKQQWDASRQRNEDAVAAHADKLLNDRRWDRLRTRGARVGLVVGFLAVLVAIPGVFVRFGSLAGLAVVMLGIAVWLALRLSVRTIADLPDDYLDERQLAVRNASYVSAYRWLASVVSVVLSAGLVAFVVLGEGPDMWTVTLTWGLVSGVFWAMLGLLLGLPSMMLALQDRV
jgi:hypothetical protein